MQHYTRLRDLREDNDLTQQQLCSKLYINKTTYTNYEQGKRMIPLDLAVTLAEFYGVSLDYIAGLTNNKNGSRTEFSRDEVCMISKYRRLTERSKGRLDVLLDQLAEMQKQDLP